jgi:hypothetical protein
MQLLQISGDFEFEFKFKFEFEFKFEYRQAHVKSVNLQSSTAREFENSRPIGKTFSMHHDDITEKFLTHDKTSKSFHSLIG